MLTAGDAQEHIRHTLGMSMSSEVSHMAVVNQAGHYLCSMHPWRWLKKRAALLDLEAGLGFVRLPRDFAALEEVRGATSAANDLCLGGMSSVHTLRLHAGATYPWRGAVIRRVMPARNLLRYSDAPSQSAAWAYSNGTGTITDNAAVNPFAGLTTAASVSDSDVTAVSTLTQTVPPHLLKDATAYTACAVLRPDPVTTTTPPKSAIWVRTSSPASGGRETMLEIQWGQTPWQDAPTVTVIGTNTGEGVALDPVPVGQAYWRFGVGGYLHQMEANYGNLSLSIMPARAAWADASGTQDVAQTGTVDFARAWVNEGHLPFDYEATTSEITVPRRLEPVLDVAPTPDTTSAGALSVLYRAGWGDAEEDSDDLTLPSEGWLDTLYLQIVRAFARGWEEEGMGTLDVRLAQIESGPIALRAKQHDGRIQPSRGEIQNSAMDMARTIQPRPFSIDFSSSSPS